MRPIGRVLTRLAFTDDDRFRKRGWFNRLNLYQPYTTCFDDRAREMVADYGHPEPSVRPRDVTDHESRNEFSMRHNVTVRTERASQGARERLRFVFHR